MGEWQDMDDELAQFMKEKGEIRQRHSDGRPRKRISEPPSG